MSKRSAPVEVKPIKRGLPTSLSVLLSTRPLPSLRPRTTIQSSSSASISSTSSSTSASSAAAASSPSPITATNASTSAVSVAVKRTRGAIAAAATAAAASTRSLPLLEIPKQVTFSVKETAPQLSLSRDLLEVTGCRAGYRMSKASDSVYAGNWYWECEILETLPTTTPTADSHNEDYIGAAVEDQPHFRVGWATKQGNIQAPVGYDKHSFGYRDVRGSKIHKSERVDHYGEAYGPGDIIGCMICLPVLPEHMQETSLNGSSNPLLQGGVFPHPFLNREDSYNSASGSVATSASGGVGCVGGAVGGGGSSYSNGSNGNGTTTTLDTTTTKDTANNNYNNNNDNNNNSNDNRNNNSSSSNGGNAAGEIEGGIEDEILRKELEALGNHVRFFKNGKDQGPAYTQIVGARYYPAASIFLTGRVRGNYGPSWICPPETSIPFSPMSAVKESLKRDELNLYNQGVNERRAALMVRRKLLLQQQQQQEQQQAEIAQQHLKKEEKEDA